MIKGPASLGRGAQFSIGSGTGMGEPVELRLRLRLPIAGGPGVPIATELLSSEDICHAVVDSMLPHCRVVVPGMAPGDLQHVVLAAVGFESAKPEWEVSKESLAEREFSPFISFDRLCATHVTGLVVLACGWLSLFVPKHSLGRGQQVLGA